MTTEVSAFDAEDVERGLLPLPEVRKYQRIFEAQATRSYLYLSLGIGLLATAFPILLIISGGYSGHDSISSFYHDEMQPSRDILVGCLCAIGVFLFLFHGLSKKENWLLNVAGVAIIIVALVPSPGDTHYGSARIHLAAAIVFFVLIGIVAVFLSKERIQFIRSDATRKVFKTAYTVVGILMIVTPIVVSIIPVIPFKGHAVFLAEWAGTWSFAAYWLIKTAEYRILLRIRWFA
jgi:hypothetical protein